MRKWCYGRPADITIGHIMRKGCVSFRTKYKHTDLPRMDRLRQTASDPIAMIFTRILPPTLSEASPYRFTTLISPTQPSTYHCPNPPR